ncbi:hypothetical protein LRS06_01745 [Hymenobacter sp. J193]|uniref:hypothetical protein n=1 Tax=Hymenobacter sp. J193 TaxID=2898429 RepID=UPI00215112FD|nr:hypothetical protein [Hymenobacter sp. J193]MCR5886515.1 hypothetical protein [Hymenobacter sp. J193]
MNIKQLIIGVLLGGLLGFGLANYFAKTSQQAHSTNETTIDGSSTKWTWPDSLDAVKAAPENHKVVYEDSTVRVLQVLLDAHKEEPIHTHKWKSIMWIAKPAVPCTIYQYSLNRNGQFVAKDSITIPRMDTNIGQPVEAEGPAGIKNLGNENGIAYRVEFKKDFKP